MQTEKGVIYRNSDGTQKNLETELGLKANTTGTYPNLSVGNATNATNAVNATNATNATKATQDGSGNTITTYYLPKNGPDLVVGQTLTSLVSGKSYLDCAITATVSSGTYYFYNCTGTMTVSSVNVKIYSANCPSLTISSNYSATVFKDGVGLLYDKDSANASLNWGYPSGIKVTTGDVDKDLSFYRHLIVSGTLASGATGVVLVGSNATLIGQSSGDYVGRLTVWTSQNHIGLSNAREWYSTLGTSTTIGDYDRNQDYFISKIYGVLK